jgi:kynurenine formamidase
MRIRSFIVAYALLLAILLFADRRPSPAAGQDRYSHIVDLTDGQSSTGRNPADRPRTRIIAPDSLIPGTWTAGQIPAERLIAPLVVMDLNVAPPAEISLDDIAAWETKHGAVPQGAVVAIRQPAGATASTARLPITAEAAQFLMDARYSIGFAVDASPELSADRTLARQLALHGNYVVEGATRMSNLPVTGSLIIVAPEKEKEKGKQREKDKLQAASVRVLAMVH